MNMPFPKRLIEIDLPIKRISDHARREKKSAGHGHLTTLHIWWARRPLAACRAVICASLWPDPVSSNCPSEFRNRSAKIITEFALKAVSDKNLAEHCSQDNWVKWNKLSKPENRIDARDKSHLIILRLALLDFIADFANEKNATQEDYFKTSQELTKAAHEALGGAAGTRPLVVDPFAGGGSIPIEALRVGADVFASDLNPVATIINKVVLTYIPRHGKLLAKLLKKWGPQIREEIIQEFGELYPVHPDGACPVAYILARTISCEGPGCGISLPLIRSLWLQKRGQNTAALEIIPNKKLRRVDFKVLTKPKNVSDGTVRRGSVTCPCCGYTTPVSSVRKQLIQQQGGAEKAQLIAVILSKEGLTGRIFRAPEESDFEAISKSKLKLETFNNSFIKKYGFYPLSEELPLMSGVFNAPIYGINSWRHLYTSRQFLILLALAEKISQLNFHPDLQTLAPENRIALITCLGLVHSKLADLSNSLCNWEPNVPCVQHLFGRQAIQMSWDFAEGNILGDARGSWMLCQNSLIKVLEKNAGQWIEGQAEQCDAAKHLLPSDCAAALITDPPYYNAVPYADLSDFFYLWLRISIKSVQSTLLQKPLTPKEEEICEMSGWDERRYGHKDKLWFETRMGQALRESRRMLSPGGIGVVVFAHKSTTGWEAMLQAMIDSGWIITASWPIDTELETRLRGMKSAALSSSVHLVCRPRESPDGSSRMNDVGNWSDVLVELPIRIHEWMPRLAKEGVVGADAIFACLGPALEIFSRYSHVEKSSGEKVILKEYLEHVWAAVAKEALTMIFEGAETSGFEEDARLTAMWLWTLRTGMNGDDEEDTDTEKISNIRGYSLEYDAARKIAQGLGVHLENLSHLVEIEGDTATLLSAGSRARYLFGKDTTEIPKGTRKKKSQQMTLDFGEEIKDLEKKSGGWAGDLSGKAGNTVLDQLHQCMILFAAGRSEAIKRFLVEEGVGQNPLFWQLAQSLSALYPANTDEKRWVDGVLGRKKGLGL